MKQKWLISDASAVNWTRKSIAATIICYFNNISEDGTWKREFVETDQVIALATQVHTLKQDFTIAKTTIALANAVPSSNISQPSHGSLILNQNGKQPYMLKPWRLECIGKTIVKGNRTHHWRKWDHWSTGIKHNGMYASRDTAGHDAWREEFDKNNKKGKCYEHGDKVHEQVPVSSVIDTSKKS